MNGLNMMHEKQWIVEFVLALFAFRLHRSMFIDHMLVQFDYTSEFLFAIMTVQHLAHRMIIQMPSKVIGAVELRVANAAIQIMRCGIRVFDWRFFWWIFGSRSK